MLIEPEDDGDEHFVDAPEAGEDASKRAKTTTARSSALDDTGYDGKKREPLYAHADTSCIWEIVSIYLHSSICLCLFPFLLVVFPLSLPLLLFPYPITSTLAGCL